MTETSSVIASNATDVEAAGQPAFSRRSFFKLAGYSAAGLAFYSGEIARHEIDIVRPTITLSSLPDAFAGFRIAQISDIHFEEFTEAAFLKVVVGQVNALRPDLVVLTGDFVSEGPLPSRFAVKMGYHCAEILGGLACPLRYAVLGNHDAMVDPSAVTDALVGHGIRVLANSAAPIERGGGRIWLSGIADVIEQRPNLSRALPRGSGADREPVILLAHEPDFADHAVNRGVSLVLSGHTHGGQVRIPFLHPLFLPPMGQKYVQGQFFLPGGMQLYVNRGIGTVGVPFRLRCPPEITLITLAQPALGNGGADSPAESL